MNELIKKLVEAWGPSGYEHRVREIIRAEAEPYADEITVDPLGNLICRVGQGGANATKIMVAAHMDEIGIMATFAEPNSGYLRFSAIGGLINTTLLGNRVYFEDGTVGVIGAHDYFGTGRTSVPDLTAFYIDVGTGDGNGDFKPGVPAAFWRPLEQRGTRLVAKSMDDRIGCVVGLEAMRRLNKQTPNEVYFVFTVQEEVGLRGARPAAYGINPDIGIALDVTSTGDMAKNPKMAVRLGDGAAIKVHDSGLVVPPAVVDWMVNRAQADGIAYQLELLTMGTTDAAGIQLARAGVPSGCISIPCRYVHTNSETVDTRDVEACIALLTGLLANPVSLDPA
ncbi:MAG: M20/M25/M40 family metallo-hydrolase [Anaerolineae bacterium]|nr:M20/M25/M40 family metallo-hydrolase [Anaerolineae bacterium]